MYVGRIFEESKIRPRWNIANSLRIAVSDPYDLNRTRVLQNIKGLL
jgi:hypothetical protein